ncbi:MAG: potassium-transporting ATPase subunit KdpC [Pseudobdellovibrio sp.]
MKQTITALRVLAFMTILTGVVYPLMVTLAANFMSGEKASGSLLKQKETLIGSELLAQKFVQNKYFWPRPSSCDYNGASSGASNFGPTSEDLKKQVDERKSKLGSGPIPQDLLFASGSGLDPHITPEAAEYQIKRISSERGIDVTTVRNLVNKLTEKPQFGILGEARVNVLKLNLALDQISK